MRLNEALLGAKWLCLPVLISCASLLEKDTVADVPSREEATGYEKTFSGIHFEPGF